MGKENRQGINVKPDQHGRICFFGGGGRRNSKGEGGNFPEQVPKCKLELVIFIGTVRIVTHHRKRN